MEPIINNITNKSEEILTYLNSKFDNDEFNLKNLDWNVKTVLSAKSENYLDARFSDIEFNMIKTNKGKNTINNFNNVSITFTKEDVEKAFNELSRIKINLKSITDCIEKLNVNNNFETNKS